MPKRSHKYIIQESSSNVFSSLVAAQDASIHHFSDVLARQVHHMLESGELIVENGIIIPARR